MATKQIELEVDFIGGQGSLTSAEEKAISDYFKNLKQTSKQVSPQKRHRISKRPKTRV
jgi:hypothetical protein